MRCGEVAVGDGDGSGDGVGVGGGGGGSAAPRPLPVPTGPLNADLGIPGITGPVPRSSAVTEISFGSSEIGTGAVVGSGAMNVFGFPPPPDVMRGAVTVG